MAIQVYSTVTMAPWEKVPTRKKIVAEIGMWVNACVWKRDNHSFALAQLVRHSYLQVLEVPLVPANLLFHSTD